MKRLLALAALVLLVPSLALAQQALELKPVKPLAESNCIFLGHTLCRAVKDKPVLILTGAQTAALIADGVTTTQYEGRGFVEGDPVADLFLGRRPTWGRMAPLGAVQIVGQMWLAEKLKTNRHRWVRRAWWLPLAIGIAANSAAAVQNSRLH